MDGGGKKGQNGTVLSIVNGGNVGGVARLSRRRFAERISGERHGLAGGSKNRGGSEKGKERKIERSTH